MNFKENIKYIKVHLFLLRIAMEHALHTKGIRWSSGLGLAQTLLVIEIEKQIINGAIVLEGRKSYTVSVTFNRYQDVIHALQKGQLAVKLNAFDNHPNVDQRMLIGPGKDNIKNFREDSMTETTIIS